MGRKKQIIFLQGDISPERDHNLELMSKAKPLVGGKRKNCIFSINFPLKFIFIFRCPFFFFGSNYGQGTILCGFKGCVQNSWWGEETDVDLAWTPFTLAVKQTHAIPP